MDVIESVGSLLVLTFILTVPGHMRMDHHLSRERRLRHLFGNTSNVFVDGTNIQTVLQ
jgi:hypothetical protein